MCVISRKPVLERATPPARRVNPSALNPQRPHAQRAVWFYSGRLGLCPVGSWQSVSCAVSCAVSLTYYRHYRHVLASPYSSSTSDMWTTHSQSRGSIESTTSKCTDVTLLRVVQLLVSTWLLLLCWRLCCIYWCQLDGLSNRILNFAIAL